jgi:hypothetical protein
LLLLLLFILLLFWLPLVLDGTLPTITMRSSW